MKKHYVLIDDSNPRFNLWGVVLDNRLCYSETYAKDIDPNELEMNKRSNKQIQNTINVDACVVSITDMNINERAYEEIVGDGCHVRRIKIKLQGYPSIKAKKY